MSQISSRSKNVFVTVGTTRFDELIAAITDPKVLDTLYCNGYHKLVLQIGRGDEIDQEHIKQAKYPIRVEQYRFKQSIRDDYNSADLVIGHAGAGTCLESLELKKRLLVVVNEKLHDNHQLELARKLQQLGHLQYCTPSGLFDVLSQTELFENLAPFPVGTPKLFADWLDNYLGLS